jgi:POT family proton-dependent oligopeptide transporter
MVIATIFFWAGRKKFVHIPPSGMGFIRQTFSGEGLSALGRLAIIYLFVAVFWSLWDQSSGGAWTLQARNMDLNFLGMQLLPEQVQTANPIFILRFSPLVNYVIYTPSWRRFFMSRRSAAENRHRLGFLTAVSFVIIAFIAEHDRRGRAPTVWCQFLAVCGAHAG